MYEVLKDGISKSLLSTFMQCSRKFAIVTEGLNFKPKLAVCMGSYGHRMIELHRLKGKIQPVKIKEGKYFEACIKPVLALLIPAYFEFWKDEENGSKHQPEYVFDHSQLGFRVRGKIDDIVNDEIVLDTKFKGRIDDFSIAKLLPHSIDGLFYCMATGLKKFTIDCVKYPTVKEGLLPNVDKLAEDLHNNPQDFFKRWTVQYADDDIETFKNEVEQAVYNIQNLPALRNLCECWHCDYSGYCLSGDESALNRKPLFSELEE